MIYCITSKRRIIRAAIKTDQAKSMEEQFLVAVIEGELELGELVGRAQATRELWRALTAFISIKAVYDASVLTTANTATAAHSHRVDSIHGVSQKPRTPRQQPAICNLRICCTAPGIAWILAKSRTPAHWPI